MKVYAILPGGDRFIGYATIPQQLADRALDAHRLGASAVSLHGEFGSATYSGEVSIEEAINIAYPPRLRDQAIVQRGRGGEPEHHEFWLDGKTFHSIPTAVGYLREQGFSTSEALQYLRLVRCT